MQAWAATYRFTSMMTARLEATLRSDCGMSLAEHDLLATLDSHGGTARMGELATALMLSKSGTTRLVAKLEVHNGWVVRVLRPEDRRAIWAELTAAGQEALVSSRPVHRATITDVLAGHVPDERFVDVADTLEQVIGALGWEPPSSSCAADLAPGRP